MANTDTIQTTVAPPSNTAPADDSVITLPPAGSAPATQSAAPATTPDDVVVVTATAEPTSYGIYDRLVAPDMVDNYQRLAQQGMAIDNMQRDQYLQWRDSEPEGLSSGLPRQDSSYSTQVDVFGALVGDDIKASLASHNVTFRAGFGSITNVTLDDQGQVIQNNGSDIAAGLSGNVRF